MNPLDPAEFRAAGHRIIDMLADYLGDVESKPLFPDVDSAEIDRAFDEPLPRGELSIDEVLDDLETRFLPGCVHVNHPGYFGLITPTPNPAGILGDLIASALNQNVGTYTLGPSAVALERRTVRWLCDLVGYGPDAGGNLTSGGTAANFLGLKLGRDFASGQRAQHEGVRDRWAAYTSEERHVAVDKAVDAVGIGRDGLRVLPTDAEYRLEIDALEAAIAKDHADGIRPACIIAIAGTTNTGAVDDLRRLRAIADRENAWLHVDAAYGGGMLLSRASPGVLAGLELADSITIDPHKWFYAPLDAGAILVRDEAQLTKSFGMRPPYLTDELDDGERYQYFVHGFEQSRRFRALKVWMSFRRYGADQIGTWIDTNCAQAMRLHERAVAHPRFVSAVTPPMSAVCIRYQPEGIDDEDEVGRLHHRVVREIERSGKFWISTTVLKGRWWFRINPVNLRTTEAHIDALFDTLQASCEREMASA